MREVHEVAGVPLAGDLPDHHVRMLQQEAQQFAAGVAAGADDGDGEWLAHRCTPQADAPATRDHPGLLRLAVGPAVGRRPAFLADLQRKVHYFAGMLTPVGAMLLRNSIV